jgi:hypothetical protein
MYRMNGIDRLDLKHEYPVYEYVHSIANFGDLLSLVNNRARVLYGNCKPGILKFFRETGFVDTLQQSGAELTMHAKCTA